MKTASLLSAALLVFLLLSACGDRDNTNAGSYITGSPTAVATPTDIIPEVTKAADVGENSVPTATVSPATNQNESDILTEAEEQALKDEMLALIDSLKE